MRLRLPRRRPRLPGCAHAQPQQQHPHRPPRRLHTAGRALALVVLAAVSTLTLLAVQTAYAAPRAGQTIDQALGCTRSIESVLESHRNDGYYLGTPYGNSAPGVYGDITNSDAWWPNGNPKPGVGAYMNCAGFVTAVIREAGGDTSAVGSHVASSGYHRGNESNASLWKWFAIDNGFANYQFDTKEAMLASGVLERGDIIYIQPVNFDYPNDTHLMFFWGSNPHEDLAWHSSLYGDGVVAGAADHGNMISRITPKGTAQYYQVYKVQHTAEVTFQKVSSLPEVNISLEGYSLAGAVYEIHRASDDALAATVTTDADGRATATLDASTAYYAVETVAPEGFTLNPERISFNTGSGTTVNLPDAPKVTVTFSKVSAEASVSDGNAEYAYAGATYEIYRASDDTLVATLTTNDTGQASCKLDASTAYYAVETHAPQGFVKNPERIAFTTGANVSTVELPDEPGTVTIRIKKTDAATGGEPQPGATLKGAVYRLTDANGVDHTATTAADGTACFEGLPLGTSRMVEVTAPEGYRLDDTVRSYTVHAGELTDAGVVELAPASDFVELPCAFDLELVKYRDTGEDGSGLQQAAEGVRFQIVSNTTHEVVGTIETDTTGRASTEGQWFGAGKRAEGVSGALPYDAAGYTVHEVSETTPEGYQPAPDWQITPEQMLDGATLSYIVDNDFVTTRIQIVKVDAETGRTVPAAGFTFQLLDADGQPISQEAWYPNHQELSAFTTDETGMVTLPEALRPGTYYVHEVATGAAPYLLNGEDVAVEVPDDDDLAPVTVVALADEQAMGQATLVKRCALADGAEESGRDGNDAEDAAAGEATGNEASDGDATGQPADSDEAEAGGTDAEAGGTGGADAADSAGSSTYDPGCSGLLAGAEYDVVAQEDIVSPDGTVRAVAGEIVDHVTTDDTGSATTKPLYLGKGSATYVFVETAAPAGHVLDATPHPFTLEYRDHTTPVVSTRVEVSDAPTETVLTKTVLGHDDTLPGATFELWSSTDEAAVVSDEGMAALAVDAPEGTTVELRAPAAYAEVVPALPEGWTATLTADDGSAYVLGTEVAALEPGSYMLSVADEAGAEVPFAGEQNIELAVDGSYQLTARNGFFTGVSAELTREGTVSEALPLPYDADRGAHVATDLSAGTYRVEVDSSAVDTVELAAGETRILAYEPADDPEATGSLTELPALLADDAEPQQLTTGADGTLTIRHLAEGSYRLCETNAPDGFLTERSVRYFTVDRNGLTEGMPSFGVDVANDYTKVDLSKRDITNEAKIPGAHLAVLDHEGNVVEEWVSGEEDHRIKALAPGSYTLVEQMTPHGYDEATAVEFTVEVTGEVQRVVMYDEPIQVTGEVDKRQQIADPVQAYTEADAVASEGGSNNAPATPSDDGSFAYTVDFRSTSSTWVDEFTVTDELDGASAGLAELTGITTPVASEDYDGLLNVWYRTNQTPADYVDPSGANATLGDGHENPWLAHETTAKRLGDDGRALDYTGWRLWTANVSATEPTELAVADLDLAEGEFVTAVRLEYGRVEQGFSSRSNGWDRELLKDAHDDIESIAAADDAAPLVVHMQATDAYRADTTLENNAAVSLFRNGGNVEEHERLEDQDHDRVEQVPVERMPHIGTTLTDRADGDHEVEAGTVTLIDTVSYEGLEPGIAHTLTGTLHDRETGETLQGADGSALTTSVTFTPSEPNGEAEVAFALETSNLGGDVVAFEQLSYRAQETPEGAEDEAGEQERGLLIAEHADLDDEGQTAHVRGSGTPVGILAQTGTAPFAIALALTGLIAAGLWLAARRSGAFPGGPVPHKRTRMTRRTALPQGRREQMPSGTRSGRRLHR